MYRAKFFEVTPHHRVLVRVHHHRGLVALRQLDQRLGFARVEQQMVAVHVQPAIGYALVTVGTVGVGAWNNHDVDFFKQRLQ